MRIRDLTLEKFGPFTGRHLAFRDDARLHVVLGPNEAGKTSALAAVTDLLFGIPRITPHDFLHEGRDLSLAATLVNRQGETLAFRRRKNRPALATPDGAALPDDALAPFLGRIGRDVFRRAFGLDAAALRASGEELKASDGELGAALFAAASGLGGIRAAKTLMDREADGIFAPRAARDRRFYQARARIDEAEAEIRALGTRARTLEALRQEIADATARLDDLRARRQAIAAERARLERLRRVQPLLDDIAAQEAGLAAFADLPEADPALVAALGQALAEAAAARIAGLAAVADLAAAVADRAAIAVDTAILDRDEEIDRLADSLGAYAKSRDDLPRVEAEARGLAERRAALARRLGLPPDADLGARLPDDASRARIAALVETGRRIAAEQTAAEAALKEARTRQTDLAVAGEVADERDTVSFRERLDALAPVLRRLADSNRDAPRRARERQALADAALRLAPPVADLDLLARAALPTRADILARQTQLAEMDARARDLASRSATLEADLHDTRTRLARLDADAGLATPERIQAARARRDAAWAPLRAALAEAAPRPPVADLIARIVAFESAAAEADRLADAAARDAQRIAEHATETARQAAFGRDLAALEAARVALSGERQAFETQWRQLWRAIGIEALAPAAMAEWRTGLDGLLRQLPDRIADAREAETIGRETEALRPHLEALAAELGLAAMPGLAPDLMAERIAADLGRRDQRRAEAREALILRAEQDRVVRTATASLAEVSARSETWRRDFAAALGPLALDASATLAEVGAVLAAWAEAPALLEAEAKSQQRIRGMRRDCDGFERQVGDLCAVIAPDLAPLAADRALAALRQRLAAARTARTRRAAADTVHARAAARVAETAADTAATERGLAELATRLAVTPDDLAALHPRLLRRQDLATRLADLRRGLRQAAEGLPEAALRADLADRAPDSIAPALALLATEEEDIARDHDATRLAETRARDRLAAIETGVGAEVALQMRRNAEAELQAAARDWTVLSLGSLMISTAIERQRARTQEPMLKAAGAIFAALTGHAFAGLRQVFDDDDVPRLSARRTAGGDLDVAHMSEGTRDQLYLALRLAFLEDFAARAEPPPFLADDLFASFDDSRTGHGLQVLAGIGDRVQPILFTHHGHVAEIARRELGDAVDVIAL